MPLNSSLLDLLENKSSEWHRWFEFVRRTMTVWAVPLGREAARMVRRFADISSDQPNSESLRRLKSLFGVHQVLPSRNVIAADGEGWLRVTPRAELLGGCEIDMAVGAGGTARRASVTAHELAHLFYAAFVELIAPGTTDHRVRDPRAERFCWDFALEFLCPNASRSAWTWELLDSVLTSDTPTIIAQRDPRLQDLITYWHLRGLARRHRISTRLAVMALDRHHLLETSRCMIAVFRYGANRYSGSDPDVRLLIEARPAHCYLIPNQRASRQGFSAAPDIFQTGRTDELILQNERITLRIQRPDRKPAWQTIDQEALCVYTPVDVKGEGRYLVASFRAP